MRTRRVITLKQASEDLRAGREFHNALEEDAGLYFIDSLFSDIESLRIHAGIHSKRFGFYRLLSKRFPFAIYYDITNDVGRVGAILDMRSNPASIQEELVQREH